MAENIPTQTQDATCLWQVERDGNPLRRHGHASPFIGKLAPLDASSLHALARLARRALPPLPQRTLAIGMTESSLLLSWFVAWHQQPPVDLRFTTRENRRSLDGRAFTEPHSHGPQHFLSLDPALRYAQVLVVEDELTTGATLSNLIRVVRDIASRVWVLTLRDLRPPDLRQSLQEEMARQGVSLEILDLSALAASEPLQVLGGEQEPPLPRFNPFGRAQSTRAAAQEALRQAWASQGRSDLYIIGECVDVALEFWSQLPLLDRTQVRHVTRSPWKVDGASVCSREAFEGDGVCSRYFLYNWQAAPSGRALIVGEAATRCISEQLEQFLESQGVPARRVEVPA